MQLSVKFGDDFITSRDRLGCLRPSLANSQFSDSSIISSPEWNEVREERLEVQGQDSYCSENFSMLSATCDDVNICFYV